jgi:hypothetical protein
MKPKRKILRFNRRLSYIFISLIAIPYLLLNLTDWWIVRLIAIPLFWLFASAFFLFLSVAPAEYWLTPRDHRIAPKFLQIILRPLFLAVGSFWLIFSSPTYIRGISKMATNRGKLEIVSGVIKRVDVQFPSSMLSVDFKIEGRKDEISLCYPKLRIAKRFPVGSKAEFYLLPGTDYAMDVKPVPGD